MSSRFKVNGEGTWYDESDLAFRMNEYDEYAVEQAVQIKEQLGNGPDITVLSIGPDRVVEMIKKALAMVVTAGSTSRTPSRSGKIPGKLLQRSQASAATRILISSFSVCSHRIVVPPRSGHCSRTFEHPLRYHGDRSHFADGIITAKRSLKGGEGGAAVQNTGSDHVPAWT